MKKLKLHHWILIGMVIGLIVGLTIHQEESDLFRFEKPVTGRVLEGLPQNIAVRIVGISDRVMTLQITGEKSVLFREAFLIGSDGDPVGKSSKIDQGTVSIVTVASIAPTMALQISIRRERSKWFTETIWWFDLLGRDLFIALLKMIIAPLILASIVAGITSLPNSRELGSIGWKTFAYYFLTTGLAVAIGLAVVLVMKPGEWEASRRVKKDRELQLVQFESEYRTQLAGAAFTRAGYLEYVARQSGLQAGKDKTFGGKWSRIQKKKDTRPGEMFKADILGPILTNPFQSLAERNSLGIIFFAVLIGLACMMVGEPARGVISFFRGFNDVMMEITLWVMKTAPVALGCIIASVVAKLGVAALASLLGYCITVVVGIAVHVCVLLLLVGFVGRMSPWTFLKGIRTAWLIAFSTTSSAATLPVTMECVTDNLGVSPKVSNFSLPVGATMNMDGTALYEGVAIIFMIQMYGGLADVPIVLGPAQTFMIFITAVLASVGAAAVPSAGLITMAIVAQAVGLPLYYIFFIYVVDHLLDMFRTSTNVMGDAAGAVIVNRLERKNLGVVQAEGTVPEGHSES